MAIKLATVKKKFKNQWVLAEVLKEDPKTKEPKEVKVIAHSPSKERTQKALRKSEAKHLIHLFTGPIPKKGYAVAF